MKLIKLLSIAVAVSVSVASACAQDTTDPSCPCPMPGRGKNMMEWHQKALEKFKEQNAELDRLVQAMNAAKGDKKIEAMAAVINKAMEQRKTWQADMEARHQKIQEWMKSRPMQSGTTGTLPSASPTVTP